jgi:hypothetical protein
MQDRVQGRGPLSGATTKRPALLRCLKTLEAGDTLIVWKLDRLGRSLRDLIHMLDELRTQGSYRRRAMIHGMNAPDAVRMLSLAPPAVQPLFSYTPLPPRAGRRAYSTQTGH